MSKIYDRLFFVGPMGLGDSFVHSGIVHHFGDRCFELHLPVWPALYDTVACLYQDHTHIKVVPLGHYDQGENQYVEKHKLSRILATDLIRIKGRDGPMAPLWDIQLYSYYELPFSLRYTNFRLPKNIDGADELYHRFVNDGEPYALIHRSSSKYPNGIPINVDIFRKNSGLPDIKYVEIKEGITSNMLQYVTLIKNATEIHCVPSSFHCLVDSIFNQTRAQLFYHDIRFDAIMKINSFWNNHRWNVVDYAEKV